MSLATGDVTARNSSALQFIVRNKLKRSRVFSLFDTHTRMRFACALWGLLVKSVDVATKLISPRIQNSSLC